MELESTTTTTYVWSPTPDEQTFLEALLSRPGVQAQYTFLDEWTDEMVVVDGWAACGRVEFDGWTQTKFISWVTSQNISNADVGAVMWLAEDAVTYLCPSQQATFFGF